MGLKKYIQKMIIIYHLYIKKKKIISTDRKRISIGIEKHIRNQIIKNSN